MRSKRRENIDAADAAVPVVAESSEAMKNLQRRRQYKSRNLHNGKLIERVRTELADAHVASMLVFSSFSTMSF